MKIQCKNCGFTETTNKELFVKVLGAAMPAFGFFAWTSFLFAGTGFAMAICIAIIAGGPALLMYKDEIVRWLASKGYKCPKCGHEHWVAMGDHVDSSQSKEFEQQKTSVGVRSANVEESNTQVEHVKKPRIKVIDISAPFILNSQEITDHHLAKELKELGSVNNGAAENRLARMYYVGVGSKQNYMKTFEYSNIAAQKGNKDAQLRLSNLYRNGWGVVKNEELAAFWLEQSRLK
ncbi:tetratricopeptide repeat protein [Acinetobacter wuhouensis]|uniref:Sel1 repeat family protein n=1 Tax=Acinetobacter wuhouensis TaxID=1879050 RepID=A0A3G2T1U0_9GAMM|nr:SEL1-like repeat protein [Acinetobacter wuhouensis]AYO53942.1 sel1 repeat family protein [Acinetobacter wuhouensis]